MEEKNTNLPASIQGDGRKFISLLKDYLKDLQDKILEQYNYVNSIFNATTDNPDVIEEQVHSITVDEKNVNGNVSLTLKWNSDDIKNYAGCVIDVKEGTGRGFMDWKNTEWTRHYTTAKTNTFVIENCVPDHIYYIRIRAKDIVNALSRETTAPFLTHYIEADSHPPRPPYEFTVVFDKRGAYWSWKQYDQNKYMWSELRLDTNVGEEHNRLDVTTDLWSDKIPFVRSGKAYLYNRGFGNAYSEPCVITYSAPVLPAPKNITVEPVFEGLSIKFDNFPDTAVSAVVYVNNEPHEVKTNHFTYLCSTGTYKIKIAFKDPFGEGAMSKVITQSTEEGIPPDAVHITKKTVFDDGVIVGKYIGDRQIVGTKIVEDTITTGHLRSNAITSNKIAANAITTEKVEAGAIVTEHMKVNSINGDRIIGSTLQGDKILAGSITGDRLVAGAITGDKIMSNTITASHLKAGTIDLDYTGIGISGGGVSIDNTGMTVRDSDKSYTKFGGNGIIWYDTKGNGFGAVRRMVKGNAQHGDYIQLNWDKEPFVIVVPDYRVHREDAGSPHLYCRAVDVSKNGFKIEACMSQPSDLYFYGSHNRSTTLYSTTGTSFKFKANKWTKVFIDGKEVTGHGFVGSHQEGYPVERRWCEPG